MKRTIVRYGSGFHVLIGDAHSQAASMVISKGGSEGSPDNFHKGADQWLYVESGTGNTGGRSALRTLNFYVPPAYTSEGDELPRATGS
jgi:hypothetical protein